MYIRHRAARHEWSVLKAFVVLLLWIGILLGDIKVSACTISHHLADPGRPQNRSVFTTLEPLRPANEALLKGPRSLLGAKGPKGTPGSSKWTPKESHWEPQGCPKGAKWDTRGGQMEAKGSHMDPKEV